MTMPRDPTGPDTPPDAQDDPNGPDKPTSGRSKTPEEMFEGARFRVEIEGQVFEAPYDLEFSDLTVDEVILATRLGGKDQVTTTIAFMFVKLQRAVPPLTVDYFESFRDALAPMFAGDGSIIILEDR